MQIPSQNAEALRQEFLDGQRLFYLAFRLYEPYGRTEAMELEKIILEGVRAASSELGENLTTWPVFFPFRDTFEGAEEAQGALTWQAISDACSDRLAHTFALVAFLRGPSFDDGIGVELGEAIGLGLPTIIFTNDINQFHSLSHPEITYTIGPIVDTLAGCIIANGHLYATLFSPDLLRGLDIAAELPLAVRSYSFTEILAGRFELENRRTLDEALSQLKSAVRELVLQPGQYMRPIPSSTHVQASRKSIFVEFDGQRGEWQKILVDQLEEAIRPYSYEFSRGLRYDPDQQAHALRGRTPAEALAILAQHDLTAMLNSSVVVINANGPEVPFESAVLQGIAHVLGKRVILYYSDNQAASDPPALPPLFRNPLPAFAHQGVAHSLQELQSMLSHDSEADANG